MILLDFSGSSVVMFHGDLPYSSKDILKKLETMDEENIIGAGGFGTVYKLAMDDGNVFALKRIVKTNEGLDRFFDRELEILGSVKHRYLVNLRGYCNSPSSKLLIYDYLQGGSLDEVLHGKLLSLFVVPLVGSISWLVVFKSTHYQGCEQSIYQNDKLSMPLLKVINNFVLLKFLNTLVLEI